MMPRGEVIVPVVGVTFRDGLRQLSKATYRLRAGDPRVDLVAEPDNEHDPNAVAVYVRAVHVGYLPRDVAARMDEPRKYRASVAEVYTRDDWGLDEKDAEILGLRLKVNEWPRKDCGCYVNDGGYEVLRCSAHELPEEPPRREWDNSESKPVVDPAYVDDPRREQNREYESW